LATRGDEVAGKTAIISCSGNGATYAIEKLHQLGAKAITASDSSGYNVNEDGIDVDVLREVKQVDRLRISAYAERRPRARFVAQGRPWEVPGDVAIPSATQNELGTDDASALIRHGVIAVVEGANMPCTPDA